MFFPRHPFTFFPHFLNSGRGATEYLLPTFCRPEEPLEERLDVFRSRLRSRFRGFFNFRGKYVNKPWAEDVEFMKQHLWHSSALLGFLEDSRTRSDLKDGKIPTLVRFERPKPISLHDRIIQNIPLFGVSTAALINLGVPLPWNMMGAGFAATVREFADQFHNHHEFQSRLRAEFKKTGRDPQTYLDLYDHLDHIIPHPLSATLPELSIRLRTKNYRTLKAFHAKLDEVHMFGNAYLGALHALKDDVASGKSKEEAIEAAVERAVDLVRQTKQSRSDLEPELKSKGVATAFDHGLIDPTASEADLDALQRRPLVADARHRIQTARGPVERAIQSTPVIRMSVPGKRKPPKGPKPKK